MNRLVSISIAFALAAGCGGDDNQGNLVYTNPPAGGLIRLVKDKKATGKAMLLDLVVGDQPLVGYSAGIDLPLDATKVTLGTFTPGTALDPGSAPAAAAASLPADGPLANMLVLGISQKATSSATDASLAPGAVLLQIELDRATTTKGTVFDGTASDFVLPSGGLRDRSGMTVVDPTQVSIGKLAIP